MRTIAEIVLIFAAMIVAASLLSDWLADWLAELADWLAEID